MNTNAEEEAEIYESLGQIVVNWNACEGRLRDMLIWLAGGRSPSTLALTAHLSAKALVDALLALVGNHGPEVRDHFAHYAKGLDTLREYRNYYLHCISYVGAGGVAIPEVRAWITHVTGKQKVLVRSEAIDISPLRELAADLMRWRAYGYDIHRCADPSAGPLAFRQLSFGPWPKKPRLPEKLRKPPATLLGRPPDV